MIDADWTVGGGLRFYDGIIDFLEETKAKYGFNEHIVDSVYDCPPGLIWEGGRSLPGLIYSLDDYIKRIRSYNERGIGFRFAFSNTLIQDRHLDDDMCNYVLNKTENTMNGVLVASDTLKEYIEAEYSKFKIFSSICRCDRDYNSLLKSHDVVVIQPDDNLDFDKLSQIDELERIEVLVNEQCAPRCKFRKQHYDRVSELNLRNKRVFKHEQRDNTCFALESEGPNKKKLRQKTNEDGLKLSIHDVKKLYDLGIRRFKLQGRQNESSYIQEQIDKYIRKPLIRSMIQEK